MSQITEEASFSLYSHLPAPECAQKGMYTGIRMYTYNIASVG